MKIDKGLTGAAAMPPDYRMLRATLIAAQAATPTARLCREAGAALSPAAGKGEHLLNLGVSSFLESPALDPAHTTQTASGSSALHARERG